MKTRERSALSALAGLLLLFLLAGCGSTNNNTNNGKQIPSSEQAFYAQSILFTNHSTLMAAGYNGFGQLGNYTILTPHPVIEPVFGLPKPVVGYSVGANHVLAFGNNSTVYAWGCNYEGRLGTLQALPGLPQSGSSAFAPIPVPIQITDVNKNKLGVRKVAAGWLHSMALTSDGSVYTWGGNTEGQLAFTFNDQLISAYLPTQVMLAPNTPLSGIKDIAAGGSHCLALTNDGTAVYAWGYNFTDQLGYETLTGAVPALFSPAPKQVMYNDNGTLTALGTGSWGAVKSVYAAGSYSMAIMEDGTLVGWGYNMYGQLGNNPNNNLLATVNPVQVKKADGTAFHAFKVSLGLMHVMAMESDGAGGFNGKVYAWGLDQTAQLGDGQAGFVSYTPTEVAVILGQTVTDIYAFGTQSFARIGGRWWGWGDNTFGQMGVIIPVNAIAYNKKPVIWPADPQTPGFADVTP